MLATRQGSLTLALICAICAAGILVFALGRYKTSLKTPVTQASVLVATSEIPKGTSGQQIASQRLYKVEPVAVSQVTPGALSDAAVIADESAATDIMPGQQLTTADFAGITTVSQTLAPDERAVEVTVSEAPGATDIVQAGDHVDVYAQLASSNAAAAATSPTGGVVPLLTDVLVLKSGSGVPAKRDGVTIAGQDMVLELKAEEVHPLISAVLNNHALYVSLRPSNATPTPGTLPLAQEIKADASSLNLLQTTPQGISK